MPLPETYPSGWTTRVNSTDRTLVQPPESIGTPFESAATDVSAENSAFALLKGIGTVMGLPVGSGFADVNDASHVYPDLLATLGSMDDAPATDAAEANSAMALLKGICVELGI